MRWLVLLVALAAFAQDASREVYRAGPGVKPPKFVPPNSALKITLSPTLLAPDYQQSMLREFRTIFNVQ